MRNKTFSFSLILAMIDTVCVHNVNEPQVTCVRRLKNISDLNQTLLKLFTRPHDVPTLYAYFGYTLF